jgi:hypothetical protein
MKLLETWHRRQALILVAQLPEAIEDAKLVLMAMQDLVDNYLIEAPAPPRLANVVPLMPV